MERPAVCFQSRRCVAPVDHHVAHEIRNRAAIMTEPLLHFISWAFEGDRQ